MMENIHFDEFVRMLNRSIEIIEREHKQLSELDSISGDGDHGTTMLRAMKLISKAIKEQERKDLKSLFGSIGWSLLGVDGGATGPLLGTMFKGMSESLEDERESASGAEVVKMFESGLRSLEKITKARIGDKTMMDALEPAIHALRESVVRGSSVLEAFKAAAEAAERGAEETTKSIARFGRAKNLGDKTLGHKDPGATSMMLIFRGFYEGLLNRE